MQVRENLELSFVQEAEMVFTTLSSTGRKIFSRLENAFENVLVDEAAQASEIAVLQPLTLGCTRYPPSLFCPPPPSTNTTSCIEGYENDGT